MSEEGRSEGRSRFAKCLAHIKTRNSFVEPIDQALRCLFVPIMVVFQGDQKFSLRSPITSKVTFERKKKWYGHI